MNLAKAKYVLEMMPWTALISGFFLYFGDSLVQGVIPHLNAGIHELGHYAAGKLLGLPVSTVNIGNGGNLLFPPFEISQTTFNIHRLTESSHTDPGAVSPSIIFFFGGPILSILWGLMLAKSAKAVSAKTGHFVVALTIILALCSFDSIVGRGLFNLVPGSPNSDGYKIYSMLFSAK